MLRIIALILLVGFNFFTLGYKLAADVYSEEYVCKESE